MQLLILLALPIAEIAVFIIVGGIIGLFPTLLLIILSAFAGSMLLRKQGFSSLMRLRQALDNGEAEPEQVGEPLIIALAGFLLILPGFITDAIGIALFIPATRHSFFRWLNRNVQVVNVSPGQTGAGPNRGSGNVVDLDEQDYESHTVTNDKTISRH